MKLTPKAVAYCLSEEGLVQEAYKDSVGVWTWAGGVTNASGHIVYPRYLDKTQPIAKCLEITVWLMRQKYLPVVERTFAGHDLTEAQIAAALSFQWNTGAISRANWAADFKRGDEASARKNIMQWSSRGMLTKRRDRERALFFDGKWPDPMTCPVYPVAKPSYAPRWAKVVRMDLTDELEALGGWE